MTTAKTQTIRKPRPTPTPRTRGDARRRLLTAAIRRIRERGYANTSVDELCADAGVTKGAFFHHFPGKEALAIAAAEDFQSGAMDLFDSAPHRKLDDPVQRLLAYVLQRRKLLRGELPEFTCLLGTLVQETYATHPTIREACNKALFEHIDWLESDVRAALARLRTRPRWSAKSLAIHIVSVLQGAFILAKAQSGTSAAIASVDHLHRYLEKIFASARSRK